jgi:hypothetical protein
VTPDDTGSATPPFASARVQAAGAAFEYHVGWLPAGSYTAALTCQAADDDPETDDSLSFLSQANVELDEGESETVDFQ